jgi:hypothetical protein
MEKAIQWFEAREDKVFYSMIQRDGQKRADGKLGYDCSSSEYYALIEAGLLPKGTKIGNTDSLFNDLEKNGWLKVEEREGKIDAKRGDIFIWGVRGASSGSFGHTGMFVNENDIIHCSYAYDGIAVSNHDWLYALNGNPANTIYRYVGKKQASLVNATAKLADQVLEVGSKVQFKGTYRVDDLKLINGIWQVRTKSLCPVGFTWADNGVPAAPIQEVSGGKATKDQVLGVGSQYKVPGTFKVLDLGLYKNRWMVLLSMGGWLVWVDAQPLTEVV